MAAGVFSAVGLLFSKLEVNETAPFLHRAAALPLDRGRTALPGARGAHRRAHRRRRARHHSSAPGRLPLRRPGVRADRAACPRAARSGRRSPSSAARFEAAHLARYGHAFSGEFPVEVVNLRLVGLAPDRKALGELRYEPERGHRPMAATASLFRARAGPRRDAGRSIASALTRPPRRGPMIIEEYEGTAVVPPDCTAQARSRSATS